MSPRPKVSAAIEDVTHRNIETILCQEEQRRSHMPGAYRAVARIAAACGTIGFFIANAIVFVAWVGFNEFVVAFDPYPYTFLLFGVSLEAIFLSILILISQNLAATENERRHHLDLQMNLLAEREQTALMRLTLEIARRVGVDDEDAAEVRAFATETDPSAVLTQIVDAEKRHRA